MIEFVEAVPLARILAEHRTITAFLNEHNPDGPGAFPTHSQPGSFLRTGLHTQRGDLKGSILA